MTTPACPSYAGYRFSAEIISHAVGLYERVVGAGADGGEDGGREEALVPAPGRALAADAP
jgi:hypothetical protein